MRKKSPASTSVIDSDTLKNEFGISDLARKAFARAYPLFSKEAVEFLTGKTPGWLLDNRGFDFEEWPKSKRITQSCQIKHLLDFLLREGRGLEKKVAVLAGTRLEDAAKMWAISGLAKDVVAYEYQTDRVCSNSISLDACRSTLKEMSPYKENFSISLEASNILNAPLQDCGILDLDFCNNPLIKDEEKLVRLIGRNVSEDSSKKLFAVILTIHFGRGKKNKKEFLPLQLREFEHKLWDRYRLEILEKNRMQYRRPCKGVGMASILYVLEKRNLES